MLHGAVVAWHAGQRRPYLLAFRRAGLQTPVTCGFHGIPAWARLRARGVKQITAPARHDGYPSLRHQCNRSLVGERRCDLRNLYELAAWGAVAPVRADVSALRYILFPRKRRTLAQHRHRARPGGDRPLGGASSQGMKPVDASPGAALPRMERKPSAKAGATGPQALQNDTETRVIA